MNDVQINAVHDIALLFESPRQQCLTLYRGRIFCLHRLYDPESFVGNGFFNFLDLASLPLTAGVVRRKRNSKFRLLALQCCQAGRKRRNQLVVDELGQSIRIACANQPIEGFLLEALALRLCVCLFELLKLLGSRVAALVGEQYLVFAAVCLELIF